jgi:hypothetical protein
MCLSSDSLKMPFLKTSLESLAPIVGDTNCSPIIAFRLENTQGIQGLGKAKQSSSLDDAFTVYQPVDVADKYVVLGGPPS